MTDRASVVCLCAALLLPACGGGGEGACAAPTARWQGRDYVPTPARRDVSVGERVGTWTYASPCPDAFGVVVDDREEPTTITEDEGDVVSVPLYRLKGIDPKIAVSDGVRVFVAEGVIGKAMPADLRLLIGDEH
jgi:hypothetical protein